MGKVSFYAESPWPTLSQGDLFSGFEIREFSAPNQTSPKTYSAVQIIVLSHSCEIDKPNTNAYLCAQLRALSSQKPSYQAAIRAGDVANVFYVPAVGPIPESYVDFRLTHRIARANLLSALAGDQRVACLSADAQLHLQLAVYSFFAHVDLPEWVARMLLLASTTREYMSKVFGSRSR